MIWKVIEKYPNYSVSSCGKVLNNRNGKNLSIRIKDGYCFVKLSNGTKDCKRHSLHRLVASAFIANPENKTEVNHIDGNKLNCNVENLEWITRIENIRHAIMTGLSDYKGIRAKAILQYDLNGNFIKEFRSGREANRELGITNAHKVAKGSKYRKTAGGFIFKFKDQVLLPQI